jgi:hypothetical protein
MGYYVYRLILIGATRKSREERGELCVYLNVSKGVIPSRVHEIRVRIGNWGDGKGKDIDIILPRCYLSLEGDDDKRSTLVQRAVDLIPKQIPRDRVR